MTPQKRNTAIYIGKVTTAILLCYVLSHAVNRIDYIGSMISAILVITLIQTDHTDHWGSAVTRVAAVVAGCAIALVATELFHNVLKLRYTEPPT